MADYTDKPSVEQLLAANRAEVDTDLSTIIDEVSETIDDAMQGFVDGPFNAVTDTPKTPAMVRRAAQYLAAAQALKEHAITVARDGLVEAANDLGTAGLSFLEELIRAEGRTAPNTKSGVTLVFGTAGAEDWLPEADEAFIASPSASGRLVTILPRTAFIVGVNAGPFASSAIWSTMREGTEYTVTYSQDRRTWVFTSLDDRLKDNPGDWTLSYRWDYRLPEGERTEPVMNGILFCG